MIQSCRSRKAVNSSDSKQRHFALQTGIPRRKGFLMKNIRRILAWAGIILLLSMYVLSLIFAVMKSELAGTLFRASIGCTILVPVLLYLFLLTAKAVKPDKSPIIDCVIFDIGCVLLDFPWKEQAEAAEVSPECREVLLNKIISTPLWNELDLNNRPFEDILSDITQIEPKYAEEIRSYYLTLDDNVSPFWYTDPLLSGLHRKGYRLMYLSNWCEHSYEHQMKKGTMDFLKYMNGGVWSFEEHVIKPDPQIYKTLISRYGLKPERCVFVDDKAENIKAAKACGLAAILFKDYNDLIDKLSSLGVRI